MALFRVSHSQYVKTLSERLQRWLRRQSRRLDSKWAEAAQGLPRTRSGVQRKGLFRRNLKAEKEQAKADKKAKKADNPQADSVTQQLKEHLLQSADQPRPQDLQARLEDLLIRCGILPSAQKGLLDLKNLHLFGDGSALPG